MEDDDRLLARLDRIGALEREGAAAGELLAELRSLLGEAEALARSRTSSTVDDGVEEVVGRLRTARATNIIGM